MAHLPLNTLPAFRAAARLQNLRAAAEELHLTHSAVSQQIKLLEEQLGVELFDRRGRGLVLNAAGAALQRAVEPALDRLAEGVRAAQAVAAGESHLIRLTVLPSFAQRWLLPRIGRWRERHPEITLEVHAGHQLVDLHREGFHAALRTGSGRWKGLVSEQLADSPLIVVGSPQSAERLGPSPGIDAIADEPLLGEPEFWERWFRQAGGRMKCKPVADFNDFGLMLQATEQDLGIALGRELLAADALQTGRLVRLSPWTLNDVAYSSYWFAHLAELADWPPIVALRDWLREEMALSSAALAASQPRPAA